MGVPENRVMAYPCARSGSRSSRREARSPFQLGAAKASALMRSFSLNSFMPRRKFSHSRVLCFWAAMTRSSMVWYSTSSPGQSTPSSSRPVSSSLRRNSVAFWASRMPPTSSRMNRGASR